MKSNQTRWRVLSAGSNTSLELYFHLSLLRLGIIINIIIIILSNVHDFTGFNASMECWRVRFPETQLQNSILFVFFFCSYLSEILAPSSLQNISTSPYSFKPHLPFPFTQPLITANSHSFPLE